MGRTITLNPSQGEFALMNYRTTREGKGGKQGQASQPVGTFLEREKKITWTLKKVQGGSEHIVVARVSLNSQSSVSLKKEFGPVSLQFNLPLFNSSRLQVKYLQILNQSAEKGQNPARWIRYMTESSSYICRI